MTVFIAPKPVQSGLVPTTPGQASSASAFSGKALERRMERKMDSVMKSMLAKLSDIMGGAQPSVFDPPSSVDSENGAPTQGGAEGSNGSAGSGCTPPPQAGAPESGEVAQTQPQPEPEVPPTDVVPSTPAGPPPLSAEQQAQASRIDAIAVLQRNEGLFHKPVSGDDVQKMIDDPSTSPELKTALQFIHTDPELNDKLDAANTGGKDQLFSDLDIRALSKSPEVVEYNREKAETYTHNFISSDPTDKSETGREINGNDAMRELYKYSDHLPKDLSLENLQNVVDGTGEESKRPPQLVAAAKYMVDHPDEWKSLSGKEGNQSISRASLNDAISRNVKFDAAETKAIQTLEQNSGDFFDGKNFDHDRLDKIINDPSSKPEVVEAAQKLKDDQMLFSMLDNAQRGHKGGSWHASDDGKVGHKDVKAFMAHMNRTPADEPPAAATPAVAAETATQVAAPTKSTLSVNAQRAGENVAIPQAIKIPDADLDDLTAVNEMKNGQLNQPDAKKPKGGGLKKFVMGLMKVVSAIEKIGSAVLGAVASLKIPGISQLAAIGSMATNAIAGGLDVGRTAIAGGDVRRAGLQALASFGSTVLSAATAPGMGNAFSRAAVANVRSLAPGASSAVSAASSAAGSAAARTGTSALAPALASAGRNVPMFQGSAITQSELTQSMLTAAVKTTGGMVASEAGSAYYNKQNQESQST